MLGEEDLAKLKEALWCKSTTSQQQQRLTQSYQQQPLINQQSQDLFQGIGVPCSLEDMYDIHNINAPNASFTLNAFGTSGHAQSVPYSASCLQGFSNSLLSTNFGTATAFDSCDPMDSISPNSMGAMNSYGIDSDEVTQFIANLEAEESLRKLNNDVLSGISNFSNNIGLPQITSNGFQPQQIHTYHPQLPSTSSAPSLNQPILSNQPKSISGADASFSAVNGFCFAQSNMPKPTYHHNQKYIPPYQGRPPLVSFSLPEASVPGMPHATTCEHSFTFSQLYPHNQPNPLKQYATQNFLPIRSISHGNQPFQVPHYGVLQSQLPQRWSPNSVLKNQINPYPPAIKNEVYSPLGTPKLENGETVQHLHRKRKADEVKREILDTTAANDDFHPNKFIRPNESESTTSNQSTITNNSPYRTISANSSTLSCPMNPMELLAGISNLVASLAASNESEIPPPSHTEPKMSATPLPPVSAPTTSQYSYVPPSGYIFDYGYASEACHFNMSPVNFDSGKRDVCESSQEADPKKVLRPKQAKRACINCRQACKKCSDARPCDRCVTLGLEACLDVPKKPRQAGVKRGPYRKSSSKEPEVSGNRTDDRTSGQNLVIGCGDSDTEKNGGDKERTAI
ncbi:hypothetical protein HDU79_010702 [Rhizoclosmatium sp. JEL0117]|nr:hypothetical protein HDU79_010702 [Rhizoclosmatium sp. JEL0117]